MSQPGTAEELSSGTPLTTAALRRRIRDLINQACEDDDVNLISEAISLSSSPGSNRSPEEVMRMTFSRVFSRNAATVLAYILTHGAEIKSTAASSISDAAYEHEFPPKMVEILLAHGWDINSRKNEQPLLWKIVDDGDVVAWCLQHGASVLPKGQRPWPDFDINSTEEFTEYFNRYPYSGQEQSDYLYGCPPLLEVAASRSTVATFELLRSKGAPLGWRVLHMAVSRAANMPRSEGSIREQRSPTNSSSDERMQQHLSDRERARMPQERMAMVRHLVNTLKIDVNARDQPPGWKLGNYFGRPLHYVAHNNSAGDCREVTWFLLERGADPDLLDMERGMTPMTLGRANFCDAVKEWRLMKAGEAEQNNNEVDRDYVGQEGA